MNYPDGQPVRLGDKVRLGVSNSGVVVCSIDTNDYSRRCPQDQWAYLMRGVVIEFPTLGLIHYEKPEPDLMLLARE